MFWYVLATIAVIGVIYTVMTYNSLVTIKHNVAKAWSNIDVLLKQRHEELPKLVETCKQYMKFEQETLEKVMQARAQVFQARETQNIGALGLAEDDLRSGLGHLFAVAENYPDLKANENFKHLQGRISNLENAIADRREFYNESVNVNNVRIEQFPDLLIAGMFNFTSFKLLKFQSAETKDVNIQKLFSDTAV